MAGTAVLYRNHEDIIVLEEIEKEVYDEIEKKCNRSNCLCTLNHHKVDLGNVNIIGFKEGQVDWDYGY